MEIENITIKDFMNAWFKKDYRVISKELFEKAFTEYIDLAELYSSKEFHLSVYIHHLNNRINCVNIFCKLQREFLDEFGMPCNATFSFVAEYGHKIVWNNNKDEFLKLLKSIESKEKKYKAQCDGKIKELKAEKQKQIANPKKETSRTDFISLLNSLSKLIGYRINTEKTTVEELAILIKDNKEKEHKK